MSGTNITFNIEPDASGDAPLELPKIEDALVESNLEPRPAIQGLLFVAVREDVLITT